MANAQEREKITGEVQAAASRAKEVQKAVKNVADFQKEALQRQQEDTSSLLEFLLLGALYLQASDIHAEPAEESVKIRLRVDGLLQDVGDIARDPYDALLSRTKLISQMRLNVADRPQDGRFTFQVEDQPPVEMRVSTLPSEYGESLVVRILNPQTLIGLSELGLREDLQKLFAKEITKPNGMIIVTGPTGSGKTTTLYAFLQEVRKPQIKIITIEDPIEYHLEGTNQTQVNPAKGYTFALGLRAIVRQDPDVILVGEIRDGETAEIAMQASLTGHLVFSTLHTNDAAGTVSRLVALGSKRSTIASSLSLVIAQRLVRKICPKCKTLEAPTQEEQKKILAAFKSLKQKTPKILRVPRAKGCKECNSTGYKGRIGIFEAILVDGPMEEFILTSDSISELKAFAIKRGMIPMYEDGIAKVVQGITTLEEVERVTEE